VIGTHHKRFSRTNGISKTSIAIPYHNLHNIEDYAYDCPDDACDNCGIPANGDQSKKCVRNAGMYREVHGEFSHNSGSGALFLNLEYGTK
jgi:hypothetical protein